MKSEEEIQARLRRLEADANRFEDLYEENFEAIQTVRWILGLPGTEYEGRGPRADEDDDGEEA